jgi:AcrR family transcriptional regulator
MPTVQPEPGSIPFEPHAERRRRQLVRAASLVIETYGVDGMRMPRVAETAGCARSLVYHYFPTREDLFVAVIEHFYERLAARIDLAAQLEGMHSLHDRDAARPLLEALWDTVEEVGSGGIILRASPCIGGALNDRLAEIAERFDARWLAALVDLGLTGIEAALAFRTAVALHTELLDRNRRNEVTRDEAIELGRRALAGVVDGLRNRDQGTA